MNAANRKPPPRTALLLACLVALDQALAQDVAPPTPDEIRKGLYSVQSSASVGLGGLLSEGRRYGQYRGLSGTGPVLLLDLDLVQRDAATGTWQKLWARDLGLPTREVRYGQERQGDWGYALWSSHYARREALIVNTGLQGVGSASQVVSATAPRRDIDLKLDREVAGLGLRKFVAGGVDVQLSLSQDETQGARMFGRGTPSVMEFLTEPVDRVTRQWQATATWRTHALQLAGGYNGSSYTNRIPVLTATGGNSAANVFGPAWVMAMAPGNAAHQAHLSGGWNFASGARTSFKVSRTLAVQDQPFDASFVRLTGAPASLGGRVATTLAYADLSLRPGARTDVVATLRWEDRDDRTPESRFLAESPATVGGSFGIAGVTGLYKPRSFRQSDATLDAGLNLGDGWRAVAGLAAQELRRNAPPRYRRMAWRERTDESTAMLTLKRSGSEWLNGSLSLAHADRGGSDYLPDTYDPNASTNQGNSLMWADRRRDRVRATADWVASETASLQFVAEQSRDLYDDPLRSRGVRRGGAQLLSADALWRLDERWSLSGWAVQQVSSARNDSRSDRVGAVALGYDTLWRADLRQVTRSAGVSVQAQPRSNLKLALDLSAAVDGVEHALAQTGGAGSASVASLPAYTVRHHLLRFSAEQDMSSQTSLRLQLTLDRQRSDDWTWTNWVYNGAPSVAAATRNSDGTTVRSPAAENVAFVGLSWRYRWR